MPQCFGGPMDGDFIHDKCLDGGVFKQGIRSRMHTFGDGKTEARIWDWCDNAKAQVEVIYRLTAQGRLIHFSSRVL